MKKLIMIVSAVVIGLTANASTVTWGISSALDTTKFADGSKVYLFNGQTISESFATWATTQSSYTFDSVKAALGDNLSELNGAENTLTLASGIASDNGKTVTSFGADSKTGAYYVYAVVIADDGKAVAITTSAKKLTIGAAATPAQAKWASSGFATYTATNVPEPTSGLLLLLGVAGMALRRRRS